MNKPKNVNRISARIIRNIKGIALPRRRFFARMFLLYLAMRGKHNFLNMSRYAPCTERQIRRQMKEPFDFFDFNLKVIREHGQRDFVWAADCSYIRKSGKHTYGKDRFWSGCDQQVKPGLEISSLCAVDVRENAAYHLECKQTPANLNETERMKFYVDQITGKASELKEISSYIVYDGAGARKNFIDPIQEKGLHLVSRLRKDANLFYLNRQKSRGLGRPRKYAGKVDMKSPDLHFFNLVEANERHTAYSCVVFSPAFKRNLNVCYVIDNKTAEYIPLFSTDLELDGKRIYRYYRSRFQIELLFRDAKQFTGLNECQARSREKLYNHFNFSLSSISFAKSLWFERHKEDKNRVWSPRDVQTQCFNQLLLDCFLANSDLNPELPEIMTTYEKMLYFGCRFHENAA